MNESSAMRAPAPDEELALELTELRRWVAFPATPRLADAVRSRIEGPAPGASHSLRPFRRRAWLWAAAVVLLLSILASLAAPGLRHAIADALGLPGIRIVIDDDDPTRTPASDVLSAELGDAVSLEAAAGQTGFVVSLPDESTTGAPGGVYLRQLADGIRVLSVIYPPSGELPEAAETGAGALFMQFQGATEDIYFEKRIRTGGTVTETRVHGEPAFWIEGTSELVMVDELSTICCGPIGRPTANVLIWSENGVTYRLETALGFGDAWLIAESVAPISSNARMLEP